MASPDELTPVERVLDQQGRSVSWLARQTAVSQTYAWRMLKGERPITEDFKAATARALGVPEDLLFPVAPAQDVAS